MSHGKCSQYFLPQLETGLCRDLGSWLTLPSGGIVGCGSEEHRNNSISLFTTVPELHS